jgi:drug/metabolite transporter (DMT)-like permease
MVDRRTVRLGYLAVVASALLFSAKSVFIKMCFSQGTSPLTVMTLRSAFALPFFMVLAFHPRFAKGLVPSKPISLRDMFAIGGLGLLGYYLASVFDIVGLAYVSAGTERLILFVYPSLVVIFSSWFFGKPIPRYMVLPLILSYTGIALSFGGEVTGASSGRPFLGSGLVFLSAVCYAIFLIGQGRMVSRIGPQKLGAYAMLFSTGAIFIHFLISQPWSDLIQPAPVYILTGLTAVLCTVVPVYLIGYGIQVVGPSRAAVVSSVGPVSTYVLSAIWLGEGTGVLQIGGLVLVLLSSFILAKPKVKPLTKVPASVQDKTLNKEKSKLRFDLRGRPKLGLEIGTQGETSPSAKATGKSAK